MAPEPFRGRRNEPALVVFTAGMLASSRAEDPGQFAAAAFDAALSLLDGERE
jgi:Tat protein secretion system quality control protein TatD with DNase activity